ncbi:hypothetical protein BC834DRAFT_976314 [Gloeopeniophorella convolvens]|nr:hypothetical protein BC834DRAFT_976314 [Gloeopeniophorella convolvens]
MYLEKAEKEDDKMTESWKGDADGILVFTGLFSATDTSAFYLVHLYQLSVAESNSSSSIPLPSLPDPSSFSPPSSAIWVNILWFLSLVISLTCALLATLLQQWARRYLRLTRSPVTLHKRARIRSFFKEGVDKLYLPVVVEALPGLLHISVFLFFAGLVVFLSDISKPVFKAILSCICASAGLYVCATLMPLFRYDSPYYTPLSGLAWRCDSVLEFITGSIFALPYYLFERLLDAANLIPNSTISSSLDTIFGDWEDRIAFHWQHDITEAAGEVALGLPWQIDGRAIQSFIQTLDEDHEIERLVAGIPGFLHSKVVEEPANVLLEPSFGDFLTHSAPRRTVRGSVGAFPRLFPVAITDEHLGTLIDWTDFGVVASRRIKDPDQETAFMARSIMAATTAAVGRTDERWFPVMMDQLGVDDSTLRRYISHGDDLLLANLLQFLRSDLAAMVRDQATFGEYCFYILRKDIHIERCLPELQHEFCKLWNGIVDTAAADYFDGFRNSHPSSMLAFRLRGLLGVLHPEFVPSLVAIEEPSSFTYVLPTFPRCPDPRHRSRPPSTPSNDPRLTTVLPPTFSPPSSERCNNIPVPSLEHLGLPAPSPDSQLDTATSPSAPARDDIALSTSPRPVPHVPAGAASLPNSSRIPRPSAVLLSVSTGQDAAAPVSLEHPEALPLGYGDAIISIQYPAHNVRPAAAHDNFQLPS